MIEATKRWSFLNSEGKKEKSFYSNGDQPFLKQFDRVYGVTMKTVK